MPPSARYAPLKDYAFIGDCRTGALISKAGSVDWLCLPEFFDDAVFAAILDADKGGRFAIRPTGDYEVSRRYLPGTAVLETTFHTADGVLRLTDCMELCAGADETELQPERELLRRVEAISGSPEVEIVFQPRPRFGLRAARIEARGRLGWRVEDGNRLFVLRAELPLVADGDGLRGRCRLRAGEVRFFSFACAEGDIAVYVPLGAAAAQRLEATTEWWQAWCGRCRYQGRYSALVERSLITLKLLQYALSGAVIAAPTTSLPEAVGDSRNWDYRYCWLRDAAFTVRSFMDLGYQGEADAFLGWLLHATRLTWPELGVLYTVYGKPPGRERTLAHLEGYRGSAPVRIGNAAREQLQMDVYGELVLAAYDFVVRGGELDRYEQRLLRGFGDTVCRRWREPDHSIWEIRGAPRQYTYSKLMCWGALDCLLELHRHGVLRVPEARYRAERDAIRAAIEDGAYRPALNAYVADFDSDAADAAVLHLLPLRYREGRDPRLAGTYRFICERLARQGLLLRYEPGFDGMAGDEGAFGICTFWAVTHLVGAGRMEEAQAHFERAAACANDLGLFGEEIDPATGAALGNFPQAFTHVGLIDAALALDDPTTASRARLSENGSRRA